jgi:hypothetical protein
MTIGAYQQGAEQTIGAYDFTATHEQQNTIGAYPGGILPSTIGAYNQFAYDSSIEFIASSGGALTIAKPIVSISEANFISLLDAGTVTILKPVCIGEARIIYKAAATPTIPLEDQNNGSLLKFNFNVRRGLQLIRDGESTPIIDFDGVRYLLDGDTLWGQGKLIWTRFSLTTLQPLDSTSFIRRYAAHNTFGELLFSGGSTVAPYPLQTTTFPDYYVEPTNGVVYP